MKLSAILSHPYTASLHRTVTPQQAYYQSLHEGLILSAGVAKMVEVTTRAVLPARQHVYTSPYDPVYVLEFMCSELTAALYDKLLQTLNTLGWYPCNWFIDGTRYESDATFRTLLGRRGKKELAVAVEPKYDVEVTDLVPQIIFHAAPAQHVRKILSQGLVPRSGLSLIHI